MFVFNQKICFIIPTVYYYYYSDGYNLYRVNERYQFRLSFRCHMHGLREMSIEVASLDWNVHDELYQD